MRKSLVVLRLPDDFACRLFESDDARAVRTADEHDDVFPIDHKARPLRRAGSRPRPSLSRRQDRRRSHPRSSSARRLCHCCAEAFGIRPSPTAQTPARHPPPVCRLGRCLESSSVGGEKRRLPQLAPSGLHRPRGRPPAHPGYPEKRRVHRHDRRREALADRHSPPTVRRSAGSVAGTRSPGGA